MPRENVSEPEKVAVPVKRTMSPSTSLSAAPVRV